MMRRILNHTALKTDVLHRHDVGLGVQDVVDGLTLIQGEMIRLYRGSPPAIA